MSNKIGRAINNDAQRLIRDLMINAEMDVEWQMNQIEKLLHKKRNLSRLYHALPQRDLETEEEMQEYMKYLNELICKVINIQYEEDLMNSIHTPNKIRKREYYEN